MGYKIGDRVRSTGQLFRQADGTYEIPPGALGVVVDRSTVWPWRVRWDGVDWDTLVNEDEIEPVEETRTERIVRRVRETGRPFIGRYRVVSGGHRGWALLWPDRPDVVVVADRAEVAHIIARQLAAGACSVGDCGWLRLASVEFIG